MIAARAQEPLQLTPPNTTVPSVTGQASPYETLDITPPPVGTIAPVAAMSGVSTPSGTSALVFENRQLISRTVSFNPFQPPDLITEGVLQPLVPQNLNNPYRLSVFTNQSLDYDSNITRSSGFHLADGYLHSSGGADLGIGSEQSPLSFNLTYNFAADLFARQTQFDTYTHDFTANARIGRSALVLVPYVIGRFRSVQSQAAEASDRQSYKYLLAGMHGDFSFLPHLILDSDFSHTTINYPARVASNFEIWDLTQQLNFVFLKPQSAQSYFQSATFFPWLEWRETPREAASSVTEINGGAGGEFSLANHFALRAQIGYGAVSSADRSSNFSSLSGFRYNVGATYRPQPWLLLTADGLRSLSFNPIAMSRATDQVDFNVAFPLAFDSHFTITPAFGLYHAVSDDKQFPGESVYLQPALTVAYKLNEHAGAFGKIQYSDDISDAGSTTSYTPDLQATLGFNVLF